MNIRLRLAALAAVLALLTPTLRAQVPQILNYQGRVAVGTVNFDGAGQFKFALVDAPGTTTYWSNDGTSATGSQPTAAVGLTVTRGLYSVLLGDAGLANMTAIPATAFANADVRLRVWFNDGTNGFQLLTPDQRLAAVGYAMIAGTVPSGAITAAKIASGAVGSAQLASDLTLGGTTTGTFSGGGTTAFQTVAGTSQNAVANTSYLLTNAALSTVTLPAAPAVGDVVRINGVGAGGWQATPNLGQSIVDLAVSSWTARESNRNWDSVASSADGTKLIAAVAGGALFTSTDSGVTWIPRESQRSWSAVASSADGTKLVAVGVGGQLYTSTNSGVTWIARNSVRDWAGVASSNDGTKLVATVGGGQLYTSTDSGVTWVARESARYWGKVASSADGAKLLAMEAHGPPPVGGGPPPGGQLYTSVDSGATWTARESNRYWRGVASSADGTKLIASVIGGQLYTSMDSGVTWTARESISSWTGVASSADGTKLLAANDGGQLYASTDSGVTWNAQEGFRYWECVASSADGAKLVAGEIGGRLYTSVQFSSSLAGAAGTTVGLQYIGNNQWQALTEATAASAKSVDAANVTGTLTGSQIAIGAIGSTQLAPNLTIGGITTGNFNGVFTGNVTGSVTGSAGSFTGVLAGDVLGTQSATVVATVGTSTAANLHTAELEANAATNASTPSTIVRRDANGNFSSGIITGNLVGNASTATSAGSFSGSLSGDVTGPQSATVVTAVGASTAASVHAAELAANAATNANVANTIVKRDASGNFSAGTVTATFVGNGAGLTGVPAGGVTGNLDLPVTSSALTGVITQNGASLMHSFGTENFFAGVNAGNFTMTGINNTASGVTALQSNTAGTQNTAIGAYALLTNTTGSINTALGLNALVYNTTGSNNTASGVSALQTNTTGSYNIAIGLNAGFNLTTGDGNIDIANEGVAGEAATIRIGNSQIKTFIAGIRGVTTGANNAVAVVIDSNGHLGTVSSSRRYKEDIADMGDASARLRALRPVTFRYRKPYDDGEKPIQFGLIAEEVAEVFPELAVFNSEGQPETVKYQDLTPLLLNEVQKLTVEKDELKKQLAETNARLSRLESLLPLASTPVAADSKGN